MGKSYTIRVFGSDGAVLRIVSGEAREDRLVFTRPGRARLVYPGGH